MTPTKIDIIKLNQMLMSGKSVKDCAKHFSVTPSAISQAKKNLNVAVVKTLPWRMLTGLLIRTLMLLTSSRRLILKLTSF